MPACSSGGATSFADDDVFAGGPIARQLSATFDEFWNNALSIPAEALTGGKSSHAALNEHREDLNAERKDKKTEGIDYVTRVATGEPFNGMVSGSLPLTWAHAQVVYDSPDKKKVENGTMVGRLMHLAVADAARAVQSEMLRITPSLRPGVEGMQKFND